MFFAAIISLFTTPFAAIKKNRRRIFCEKLGLVKYDVESLKQQEELIKLLSKPLSDPIFKFDINKIYGQIK